MNWKQNLLASILTALSAGISASLLTLFVFGIQDEMDILQYFLSQDFVIFNVVSLLIVTPVAFWSGPRIIYKFDEYRDKLSYLIVTIAGAVFGIFLGAICFIILVLYYSGNISGD